MKKVINKHNKKFNFEHGFDLTDFDQQYWIIMLTLLGLEAVNQKKDNGGYVWIFKDGYIVTGNDPLTGNYCQPESRDPERGYLSYVGIAGNFDFVDTVRKFIKTHAKYIKGESEARDYI